MSAPRRFLPSISALRALEALDRLGSASAAAAELSLTQGAVSRQLQALERQLGLDLVHRDKKKLTLSAEAQEYAGEIRAAVAVQPCRAQPSSGTEWDGTRRSQRKLLI